MNQPVMQFFTALRKIFGLCPSCNELIRLSDCKLYQRAAPVSDWKERLDREIAKLDTAEERLQERIARAREQARVNGRREADKLVKKIDPIFRPLKLNPNDAKVLFHPVDFVVFNGMNGNGLRNIVLLDKRTGTGPSANLQRSIERSVEKGHYEWLTLRIAEDGGVAEE